MEYRHTPERKTARSLSVVSGLLFWIFSFTYLAFLQAGMMRIVTEQFISESISYSPWAGAAIITTVLWLLGCIGQYLYRFPDKFTALAYLPSYLLLGALTSFNAEVFAGVFPVGTFLWVGGIVLLFFLLGWAKRKLNFIDGKQSFAAGIISNLMITVLLVILTISIGNTKEDLYHEINILCALRDGDDERALLIGRKSVEAGKEVTALRAVALHRTGKMGESLFEYPQSYGAEGLKSSFFHESGSDYDLASLLLDKDLKGFQSCYSALPQTDSLPKHYAEAMILYKHLHPELSLSVDNEELNRKFREYLEYQRELRQSEEVKKYPMAEKNRMRREYQDTYWYYYMYQ